MRRCSSTFLLIAAAVATLFPCAFSVDFPTVPAVANNPWIPFRNLSGCHFGESRPGLCNLKRYLNRFGYLPSVPPNFTDAFDDDLASALRTYQRNFRLNVTGELDEPTLDQLIAPRCGVADVINGTSAMNSSAALRGRNLFSYFPGTPTWPAGDTRLTYALTAASAVSIDPSTLRAVFASAFARWSAVTTLTFAEAASAADADITIGFYSGDHGDGEAFDGVLGSLAHAFSPTDGRFHLDAAEDWVAEGDVTEASSDVAVDLESVAVHEIGHLLGLGHTDVADAIMYPTIKTRTRKVELTGDDVEGIQSLYGINPNYKGLEPAASTTESSSETSGAKSGRSPGETARILAVLAVSLITRLLIR